MKKVWIGEVDAGNEMKFLIAGYGSIGQRHFRNLKMLGQTDFVFYRSKRNTLAADEIAGYPVETTLDAALDHKPDVVIVSNPTALHLDVAIPAAERGCHLFLEKPISHSLGGIEKLQEVVAASGVRVLVGFQFRYHPQLVRVRELLAEKVIGDVISVRVEWGEYLPGWHPWEDYRKGYSARKDLGGGVVLTLSHPIDYLRWLIGEVDSLWAFTGAVETLQIDVDSVAEIGLHFTNGVIGSLHLDYIQQPNTHSLKIIGSAGKIVWDYQGGTLLVSQGSEEALASYPLPPGFERNWMFRDQMMHLLDILKKGVVSRCTLQDGIIAQTLAMGALLSADSKSIYQF